MSAKPRLFCAANLRPSRPVAELIEFHAYHAKQAGGIPGLQRKYMSQIKALKSATAEEDRKRFQALLDYFFKYGKQYDFDPLMLAAQGYQESTLKQDAKFDEQNRALFAFASYNCGPGNVSKMRKEAVKRGLDPDQWFNNVEIVTAETLKGQTAPTK